MSLQQLITTLHLLLFPPLLFCRCCFALRRVKEYCFFYCPISGFPAPPFGMPGICLFVDGIPLGDFLSCQSHVDLIWGQKLYSAVMVPSCCTSLQILKPRSWLILCLWILRPLEIQACTWESWTNKATPFQMSSIFEPHVLWSQAHRSLHNNVICRLVFNTFI